MNLTNEEMTVITKVLIRQLLQDEGALAEAQKEIMGRRKQIDDLNKKLSSQVDGSGDDTAAERTEGD